jgi:hypothetical protein
MAKYKPKALSRYGVPKTGQLTPYVDYDDGYYQKGHPLPGLTRFVDLGDGTILDRATGLQWPKQPELIIPGASVRADNQIQVAKGNYATSTVYAVADLVKDVATGNYYVCVIAHTSNGANVAADLVNNPDSWRQTVWTNSAANLTTPKTMAWATAITNCEGLEYAGKSDWRLPNVKELMSIADYERVSPAIDTAKFPNCQSNYYWSSTSYAGVAGYAWVVYFVNGNVGSDGKTSVYVVRPVRQY